MNVVSNWWSQLEQYWRVPATAANGWSREKLALQVAATLVVILALTSGYLATERELAARANNSEEQL